MRALLVLQVLVGGSRCLWVKLRAVVRERFWARRHSGTGTGTGTGASSLGRCAVFFGLGGSSLLLLLTLWGCSSDAREVVVYTALDPVFSRTLLDEFERRTGIRVRALYDTEATKTTGLVERIRREKEWPRCDVFWNNETLRTIRMGREGLLDAYVSPSAKGIDERFRDPGGLWTGFAARARVIAFDPGKIQKADVPRTHEALLESRWKGKVVLANPQFGTTGSHLAFLFARRGDPAARVLLRGLLDNGVEVVGSNGTSRDRVVAGQAELGLTDTDDVEVARRQGESIDCVFIEEGGVILIPNSVALVKGCQHPEEARALIDYLLSEEVEERLAASRSRQIPLRASVPVPEGGLRLSDLRITAVTLEQAADALPAALSAAREILE